ncbi:alpha/beta hydrolase [Tsukamurella pseudospumae]|uniref:DUF1023 domain-containing protein n=1 Tax=Tsukamurella pseudospumae TaxID=239498 RepID=A0A137ZIZ5_9ACTN|nr:alpha/beta hydrolase [Tsukamurella pseudospumae]KXO98162.1 hypothetical protein AXK61_19145 [Tsukamurella pseudospumae]
MGDGNVFEPGTHWGETGGPLTWRLAETWYDVGGRQVSHSDAYWGNVLSEARRVYGDQGITFEETGTYLTGLNTQLNPGRRMVYGDGSALPTDGRIAFTAPNPSGGQAVRYVQNADGSVQQLARDGTATGPKITPDTFRYSPDARQVVAYKDGKPVYAAPVGKLVGPHGETHWAQKPDGTLVPLQNGIGNPLVPGSDLLEVQPVFPAWVIAKDPDFVVAVVSLFLGLRRMLGQGEPAQANVTAVPYQVPGDGAGIDEYATLKASFDRMAGVYGEVGRRMAIAVSKSAAMTLATRQELANAIMDFNGMAAAVPEDDFAGIMGALSTALGRAYGALGTLLEKQEDPGSYRETVLIPDGARAVPLGPGAAGLPAPPPKNADPKDVAAWWNGLSEDQKQAYAKQYPQDVGNVDGVPAQYRDIANRSLLNGDIDRLQRQLDDAKRYGATKVETEHLSTKLDQLRSIQAKINEQVAPQDHRSLILLDPTSNPRQVLAAIGVGDVDKARRLGVVVGGVSTTAGSLPGMVDEATAVRAQTIDILRQAGAVDPESVAMISWVGYEAPSGMTDPRLLSEDLAHAGAGDLNHFYRGLSAVNPTQEITAYGHSYGSLVTSLALQEGGHNVHNAVFYGSPGLDLGSVSGLHLAPGGHAFYELTPDDPITYTKSVPAAAMLSVPVAGTWLSLLDDATGHPITDYFGNRPGDVDGITQLSTSAGGTPFAGQLQGASGHSEYPRMGDGGKLRMSGYNFAAILSGIERARVTGK